MGCFLPPSDVNVVDLKREENTFPSHLVTVPDSDSTLLFDLLSSLILYHQLIFSGLGCFFFFNFSWTSADFSWDLAALFVTRLLSLKDLFCLVNCFIDCVYFVQIPKLLPIHCAASTQSEYSQDRIFSTQMISSLFLWVLRYQFVYLIFIASGWNSELFTKLKTLQT